MTTEDFIITLFCVVDDRMGDIPKHPQAILWSSKLVTIGLLFALKGGYFRVFYRWLTRDYGTLCELAGADTFATVAGYPPRLVSTFLADPTFFTVIDSYGIELIHPIREDWSPHQVGKKGKSNWRWIVGMKLCWLINDRGQVVAWDWNTANVHDQTFLPLVKALEGQSIVLADTGFNCAEGIPDNLKLRPGGTWNERMLVETTLALITMVCHLKKVFHRTCHYFEARWAYLSARSTPCCHSIACCSQKQMCATAYCTSLSMHYELAPAVTSPAGYRGWVRLDSCATQPGSL